MIERFVSFAEAHRGWVIGITLLFALAGGVVATGLKLDALPDVTNNQVVVLTKAPGFTPEEVETRVTRRVETALGGIPGLTMQRSISRYGISSVTAVFGDDVEPFRARQMVGERVATVQGMLPAGVETPEIGPYSGGLGEIYHFTLSSDRRTPAELLTLVNLVIAPRLRSVPGVVEVNSWGGAQRTLDVVADASHMSTLGVSLSELIRAVEAASGSVPGASVPSGSGQTLLRGVAFPRGPGDLGAAIVRSEHDSQTGRAIRVADVAQIRPGTAPRLGAATGNGGGEVVYVMVLMAREENAREVVHAIRNRMPEVEAALPDDVRIEVVYDRAVLVEATLHTVFKNLLEGGLLVVAVLFILLGSARAGLLVALTIPLSMIGAAVGMVFFGIPGNLMSLGAIDFGLLVDGGVVMVESFFHELAVEGEEDVRATIRDTARAMARPVFFSVLMIALVYVPIITLTGVDGKMFRPMALTVVFALLTSLVLSLAFVPAASSLVLRRGSVPTKEPRVVTWAARLHRPALAWAMARPGLVLGASLALLVVGGVLVSRSGMEFVPQLDEGDMVVQTTRSPDIRIESAVGKAGIMERALVEHVPEVTHVVSRIGSPEVALDIMGLEQGDVFVGLRPRNEWRPGLTKERLIEEMTEVLEQHAPGGDPDFTQPIQMRFNELLGGSVSDVSVTVFGDDLRRLRALAVEIRHVIDRVPGAHDTRISAPPFVDLVEVRPTVLHASHVGMSPADVLRVVEGIRNGIPVGETYEGPVRIPIRLLLGQDHTAYDLEQIAIPANEGRLVALSRVAEVTHVESPGAIDHTMGQRRITVGFNVRGRDLGTVVKDLRSRVAREVRLPQGYRLEYGGQYENMQDAYRRLKIVVPIVLLSIVGLLFFMFQSLRAALVIFLNVPFAAVGGMIALASRGMAVSVSSAVGFIALSGIAVLNGVVLMNRVLALEAEGRSPRESAETAAKERMRPVLMTASVAALGFVPMMLATGIGAEVQRPLATVVVGGLFTSTILTLLILPSLYPWLAARRKRDAHASEAESL
ncbi:MAG: CusA/CzcA family heavy metal efflux RND transporter [Polyangiales bacterium]